MPMGRRSFFFDPVKSVGGTRQKLVHGRTKGPWLRRACGSGGAAPQRCLPGSSGDGMPLPRRKHDAPTLLGHVADRGPPPIHCKNKVGVSCFCTLGGVLLVLVSVVLDGLRVRGAWTTIIHNTQYIMHGCSGNVTPAHKEEYSATAYVLLCKSKVHIMGHHRMDRGSCERAPAPRRGRTARATSPWSDSTPMRTTPRRPRWARCTCGARRSSRTWTASTARSSASRRRRRR